MLLFLLLCVVDKLSRVENDWSLKLSHITDGHMREVEKLKKENFVLSCKVSGVVCGGDDWG